MVVVVDLLELKVLPVLGVEGALLLGLRGVAFPQLEIGVSSCTCGAESEEVASIAALFGCCGGGRRVPAASLGSLEDEYRLEGLVYGNRQAH